MRFMKDTRKLFYKYLTVYLGLFLILVLGCLMIVRMTEKLIWDDLITKEELQLEKGSLDFEQVIASMRFVNDNLSSNESIGILNTERNGLSIPNFVEMNYAKKQFYRYRLIGGLPYGFVLYRDNPVFLSDTQVSPDYEKYYGRYMTADSCTAAEFKEMIFGQPELVSFIRLDRMQYHDNVFVTVEDPVLVVLKPVLESGIVQESRRCVFVLSKEEILEYFLVDDMLDGAAVFAYDRAGRPLIQHDNRANGKDADATAEDMPGDEYHFLDTRTAEGELSLYVGVAYSTISGQVWKLTKSIYIVLIISIIYTIVTVFFLVWRRYKPTKNMLEHLSEAMDGQVTASNEYEYVRNTVDYLSKTQKNLRRQFSELKLEMNNSILVNLLTHGIINESDKDKIKEILPDSPKYYLVILFRSDEIDEENLYTVTECLLCSFARYYGEYIYAVRLNLSEEVFIVRLSESEEIDMDAVEERLRNVAQDVTRQTDVVFSIGVSGIGGDVETMNNNYEQAQQASLYTKRDYENTVGSYSKVKPEMGHGALEITSLFQIYDFILMGNKEMIRTNLDRLVGLCERTGDYRQNRAFFSALSLIVSNAYETLGIEEHKEMRPCWNGNYSLKSQIESFREYIDHLIDAYEKNKKSHNLELKDSIILYMEQHYQNPNLTVAEVSTAMHISEKYLVQFFKEQTLKTFAKYLEELRISKAKEYLADTDWGNKEIAEAVGFGSLPTFYRVFSKKEGVSPANWKQTYMDNRNLLDKNKE